MNIEIIRNTLYKSYLESFYCFCKNIGDETADVMCEILAFEADRRLVHTFQTTRGVYIFENKLPPPIFVAVRREGVKMGHQLTNYSISFCF